MANESCSVSGCRRAAIHSHLCSPHYQRKRLGRSLAAPIRDYKVATECTFLGCGRGVHSRGLCHAHRRQSAAGRELRPIKHKAPRNYAVGYINNGYRVLPAFRPDGTRDGNKYVAEHTVVMESHLGRHLREGESVHHKNGDRLDNRLANLELWSRYQPSGQRVSDKLNWAKSFIHTYGELSEPDDAHYW